MFADPFHVSDQDRIESGEQRWQTIGVVDGVKMILVAHTWREEGGEEVIRLISARLAERPERRRYEQ